MSETITKWAVRNKRTGGYYMFYQLCDDGYGEYRDYADENDMNMKFWDEPNFGSIYNHFADIDGKDREKELEWVKFTITIG